MDWQKLGDIAHSTLIAAREQAHWAAQVISAAGETFLAHEPDTSHTAMTWDSRRSALVGREIPGAAPCRVALRIADLTLCLLDRRDRSAAELALPGRDLAEAYRWTSAAVKIHSGGALDRELRHPGYALDPHPIARKGRFRLEPGLPELARWFADAAAELTRFQRGTTGAGEVMCWPHHFDIASLVVLETDVDGDAVRSVGVGLSPGDASIEEPYWYVNHDPETERAELPALPVGEWVRGDWTGALLRGGELVAAGGARAQQARLRAYLAAAFAASRELAFEAALDPT